MKAYKVSLFYYLHAEDQADAVRQALDIEPQKGPVEIHAVEVTLRTERCDICDRAYTPDEMRTGDGRALCVYCYAEAYNIDTELTDGDIPF